MQPAAAADEDVGEGLAVKVLKVAALSHALCQQQQQQQRREGSGWMGERGSED
jgi:hypothetical protein